MAIANTTRRVPEPKPLIDALHAMLGERCSVNPGILDRHGHDESYHATLQAGRGGVPGEYRGGRRHHAPGAQARLAGDSVRRRHLARRARRGDGGRRLDRHGPHEPRGRGECRGPRRAGGGRRHAQAAQQLSARPGPVLPDRSRRRRDAGRHGLDPRQRHQRGALRHHARECAGPHHRHRRRPHHENRRARAQIGGGLRPDAAVRRIGGHARRHHRSAPAALWHSGDHGGGGDAVPDHRRRGQHGDPRHPVRPFRWRASSCWTSSR